jgi:DUF4097 and DUF4098 domain-containing protein YvlB
MKPITIMRSSLLLLFALSLSAQLRDNRDKTMTCRENSKEGRAHLCNISEQTLGSPGALSIDAGRNGGVTVKGWSQNQMLVRAKIEVWAETESDASLLAGQVRTEISAGVLRATGPETNDNRSWSVSWEVFAPHTTDLKMAAHNGGVSVSDVRGRLDLSSHNGGISVARVEGEIKANTHNGGVHVTEVLSHTSRIQLESHNGGIQLSLPASFSAQVHGETGNGSIQSDFAMPVLVKGERRPRVVDFTIGGGGPSIQLKTNNGGVVIRKI